MEDTHIQSTADPLAGGTQSNRRDIRVVGSVSRCTNGSHVAMPLARTLDQTCVSGAAMYG